MKRAKSVSTLYIRVLTEPERNIMLALADYLRHTYRMIVWYFSVFDPIESGRDIDRLVWAWLTEEE